jgi:tetratricopeptide (TPR) repeat protein
MSFVGEKRQEIVRNLHRDFQHVKDGHGPKMVFLTSPVGWGKTRIVQEFYRQLATMQSMPQYWPSHLVDESGLISDSTKMSSVLEARKLVYPRKVHIPNGASMDWMWWGILCHQRHNNEYSKALFDHANQLAAHANGLNAPSGPQVVDISVNIVSVLGLLGIVALSAPATAALTVASASLATFNNAKLVSQLSGWIAKRRLRDLDIQTQDQDDEIKSLTNDLTIVTRKRPLILVIDDAHDADETLVKVLDRLVTNNANVLVIATGWPGFLTKDSDRPIAKWWSSVNQLFPNIFRREELTPLNHDEMVQIAIEDGLPKDFNLDVVDGNPLALRAGLRLPVIRREIEAGRSPDLTRYTNDPDVVFSEYWDGLPSGVRHVLSIAAQIGPRFVPSLVTVAALEAGIENAQENLSEGKNSYQIARAIDEVLHEFSDSLVYSIADRRGRERELSEHDIHSLHSAIIRAVTDSDFLEGLSPEARKILFRRHLNLVLEGLAPTDSTAINSAWTLAKFEAANFDYAAAIHLATSATDWLDPEADFELSLDISSNLGNWNSELGMNQQAIEIYTGLIARSEQMLGIKHPDSLRLRGNLALVTGRSGRINEAIEILRSLENDLQLVLGADHPDALLVKLNLLKFLRLSGQSNDHKIDIDILINALSQECGADHILTLEARVEAARVKIQKDPHANLLREELDTLVGDLIRILGENNETVQDMQLLIDINFATTENIEQLINKVRRLVNSRTKDYGPKSRIVLETQLSLVSLLFDTGSDSEALEMSQTLMGDHIKILGADDHQTKIAVQLFQRILAKVQSSLQSRLDQLLNEYEKLTRIHGPDDSEVLKISLFIGVTMAGLNRIPEAVAYLEELLIRQIRIEGLNSPGAKEVQRVLFRLNEWTNPN